MLGLGRGIQETVDAWGVYTQDRYTGGQQRRWVAFPFRDFEGKLVNVKYRTVSDKMFSQEKDAEQLSWPYMWR